MKKYWVILASSLALAACKTTPTTTSSAEAANGSGSNVAQRGVAGNAGAGSMGPTAASVYFDYDQSAIKSQFRDVLGQQAQWLKSHHGDTLTLEGNTDERGSAEYNLALGGRRAAAVRKALVTLGVSEQRAKDVSYGKEKPKATCHEEKCWAENRRVDFVHTQG